MLIPGIHDISGFMASDWNLVPSKKDKFMSEIRQEVLILKFSFLEMVGKVLQAEALEFVSLFEN